MENNHPFLDDIRADDLFIMSDILDDCNTEPFPSEPNPNFPDIDFDEWEDCGEPPLPWLEPEGPTWLN